jgi:hypothetical protein
VDGPQFFFCTELDGVSGMTALKARELLVLIHSASRHSILGLTSSIDFIQSILPTDTIYWIYCGLKIDAAWVIFDYWNFTCMHSDSDVIVWHEQGAAVLQRVFTFRVVALIFFSPLVLLLWPGGGGGGGAH